jgi:hypothetical protein
MLENSLRNQKVREKIVKLFKLGHFSNEVLGPTLRIIDRKRSLAKLSNKKSLYTAKTQPREL